MHLSDKERLDLESKHPQRVKILTIGYCTTGRTSVLNVLANRPFDPHQGPTLGVDFVSIVSEDDMFKIRIYDTSGVSGELKNTVQFYKSADVVIFVFSVESRESFDKLEDFIGDVKINCGSNIERLLTGNKTDCANREVGIDEAEKWN